MKKKLLLSGFGILLLVFTACENSAAHEHTFSSEWTYDADAHWHESTCGHDIRSREKAHTLIENVVKPTEKEQGYTLHSCTVCGYSYKTDYTNYVTPVSNKTTYTVTFLDYDYTMLYRATEIKDGDPAIFVGRTPTRPETDEYTYSFAGWDKDLSSIHNNLSVVALYNASPKTPSVTPQPIQDFASSEAFTTVPNTNELEISNIGLFDSGLYAFYFDLGLVKRTPVYTSFSVDYRNQDLEIGLNFNKLTSQGLENSISKAVETVDTHSYTGGFTIGFEESWEWGADVLGTRSTFTFTMSQETDHHWTNNWGSSVTESKETRNTYVEEYSEGHEVRLSINESNGYRKGYSYRVSFYETVRCYGILLYNPKTGSYNVVYENLLVPNQTRCVVEESINTDGDFRYDIAKTLTFDVDKAMQLANGVIPTLDKMISLSNGNEATIVYVNENNEFVGNAPVKPAADNKFFVGYFSSNTPGQGECYIDSNMNIIKEPDAASVLYARWAQKSTYVENHAREKDNEYSSKNNNESKWDDMWKGHSPAFASGYSVEEAIDAKKGGYKYVRVDVNLDIYESDDGWEWIAFRLLVNDVFAGDLAIYRVSVKSKEWITVKMHFTIDASYLTNSTYKFQYEYGVSGNNSNKWKRGHTETRFTLVKDPIASTVENVLEGGIYSI